MTIPTGTILYHGRYDDVEPTTLEWLALNFELSRLFCGEDCFVLSYIAMRPLRLVYFDGSSASKMLDGTLDAQNVLVWGTSRPEQCRQDTVRIKWFCDEWGQQFGLDGVVRMEPDLYVLRYYSKRRQKFMPFVRQ